MQHALYKREQCVGPGGYKCVCCGPAPSEKRKFDRHERRRLKERFKREIRDEINEFPGREIH
jgi:hypothetical protein